MVQKGYKTLIALIDLWSLRSADPMQAAAACNEQTMSKPP
jgi:hypothetical protein